MMTWLDDRAAVRTRLAAQGEPCGGFLHQCSNPAAHREYAALSDEQKRMMMEEREARIMKRERDAAGRPSCVTFNPEGHRDVVWCCYFNEPAILEWRDSKQWCVNCSREPDPVFHMFICHINKPEA